MCDCKARPGKASNVVKPGVRRQAVVIAAAVAAAAAPLVVICR